MIELLWRKSVRPPTVTLGLGLPDILLPMVPLGLPVIGLRDTALPRLLAWGSKPPGAGRGCVSAWFVTWSCDAARFIAVWSGSVWCCIAEWLYAWAQLVSWRPRGTRRLSWWWICAGRYRAARWSRIGKSGRSSRGGRGSTSAPARAVTRSVPRMPNAKAVREIRRISYAFTAKEEFPDVAHRDGSFCFTEYAYAVGTSQSDVPRTIQEVTGLPGRCAVERRLLNARSRAS